MENQQQFTRPGSVSGALVDLGGTGRLIIGHGTRCRPAIADAPFSLRASRATGNCCRISDILVRTNMIPIAHHCFGTSRIDSRRQVGTVLADAVTLESMSC